MVELLHNIRKGIDEELKRRKEFAMIQQKARFKEQKKVAVEKGIAQARSPPLTQRIFRGAVIAGQALGKAGGGLTRAGGALVSYEQAVERRRPRQAPQAQPTTFFGQPQLKGGVNPYAQISILGSPAVQRPPIRFARKRKASPTTRIVYVQRPVRQQAQRQATRIVYVQPTRHRARRRATRVVYVQR